MMEFLSFISLLHQNQISTIYRIKEDENDPNQQLMMMVIKGKKTSTNNYVRFQGDLAYPIKWSREYIWPHTLFVLKASCLLSCKPLTIPPPHSYNFNSSSTCYTSKKYKVRFVVMGRKRESHKGFQFIIPY